MAILFTFERADPRAIVRFVVPPSGRRSLTTIPERLTLGFRAVRVTSIGTSSLSVVTATHLHQLRNGVVYRNSESRRT